MNWHGFGMYGMFGNVTDPNEAGFSERVAHELGVDIHGSPYRDYEAEDIAKIIETLPADDGVFVWGSSLGANNTPVVASLTSHRIDGAFGFQASIYGNKTSLNPRVQYAHLIYSYIPWNFGLGAYLWKVGTMNPASYHKTRHDLPHPGDYDLGDQLKFINEMRRIMAAGHGNAS